MMCNDDDREDATGRPCRRSPSPSIVDSGQWPWQGCSIFRGAVSRPDGMRAIAMAVLIGMMAPLFIVTVVAVVRVLLLRLFDG